MKKDVPRVGLAKMIKHPTIWILYDLWFRPVNPTYYASSTNPIISWLPIWHDLAITDWAFNLFM